MKRLEFVAKLDSKETPWVTSVVELAEAAGVTLDTALDAARTLRKAILDLEGYSDLWQMADVIVRELECRCRKCGDGPSGEWPLEELKGGNCA